MNFFGKKNSFFDDDGDGFYDAPMEPTEAAEEADAPETPAAAPKAAPAPSAGSVGLGGNSIELKVVRPDKFEDVAGIAEHLLNHRTVVLNLEAANKEVCRRLIDFLSGVAYSIGGQIRRVAVSTYIITPSNVDVSEARPTAARDVMGED